MPRGTVKGLMVELANVEPVLLPAMQPSERSARQKRSAEEYDRSLRERGLLHVVGKPMGYASRRSPFLRRGADQCEH